MLHLIYRLIVQPNISRANMFSQSFTSSAGVEALLVLLQREAKAGNKNIFDHSGTNFSENNVPGDGSSNRKADSADTRCQVDETESAEHHESFLEHHESAKHHESVFHEEAAKHETTNTNDMLDSNIGSRVPGSENGLLKNLGGISFSITSDNVRNNVYNVDKGDGIVVGIIHIIGALVGSGHLKLDSIAASPNVPSGSQTTLNEEGNTMSEDRVSLLLFALQKALQAAPRRLMTANVYMALISAAVWVFFSECYIIGYVVYLN